MELNILGCSGAKSIGRSPTSFLIDNTLLIDCGSVVSKLQKDSIVENIEGLLLTHSHFDHILELPFLLELLLQSGRENFDLYVSEDSKKSLLSNVFNFECWPDLFQIAEKQGKNFKINEYKNLNTFLFRNYRITPVKVNHTITTHGFILEGISSSIAFTGDTYVTDSFWEQCTACENLRAVIVDVSFPASMSEEAEITKHLSTELFLAELEKLNRKDVRILVSHMKPFNAEEIISELENAETGFDITFLEDGMVLDI